MVADIWLISDTHFSHKNIIKFKKKLPNGTEVEIRRRPIQRTAASEALAQDIIGVPPLDAPPELKKTLQDRYSLRPFNDIHEHNQYLTEKWNSVVKPGDHVWHGGDFGDFRCKKHLNGVINLIVGNHDEDFQHYVNGEEYDADPSGDFRREYGSYSVKLTRRRLPGFKKIRAWRYWDVGGVKFVQTHMPLYMGPGEMVRKWQFNVHGHLHQNRIDVGPRADMRYLNVSVECLDDYTPIHIEEVARILKKRADGFSSGRKD